MRARCGDEGRADVGTPENPEKSDGFFRHFTEELRNQFRGTPTEPPPPKPPAKK